MVLLLWAPPACATRLAALDAHRHDYFRERLYLVLESRLFLSYRREDSAGNPGRTQAVAPFFERHRTRWADRAPR